MNMPQQPVDAEQSLREWERFQHEVVVAADSLAFILDGISRIHRNPDAPIGGPKLRGFPMLTGEEFLDRTRPYGPMMQTVFKGWFAEVDDLWESVYRPRLSGAMESDANFIRHELDVLAEFRHICNNLLQGGIAREGEAGSCRLLRWFRPSDPMQMYFWHVLDFLNQMGWLKEDAVVIQNERQEPRASRWHIERDSEPEQPAPRLVSVRPLIDLEADDPIYRYGVGVAFENGVFGNIPFGFEDAIDPNTPLHTQIRQWHAMRISNQGDLVIPGVATVSAEDLYRGCLAGPRSGVAPWSSTVRFKGQES